MQVIAHQGDTVDAICHRHLNSSSMVEQVLSSNPAIAFMGAVLPMGTALELPEQLPQAQKQLTQLWD